MARRRQLLEELLRVEPVVGYLRRRTTRAYAVDGPDGPVEIGVSAYDRSATTAAPSPAGSAEPKEKK